MVTKVIAHHNALIFHFSGLKPNGDQGEQCYGDSNRTYQYQQAIEDNASLVPPALRTLWTPGARRHGLRVRNSRTRVTLLWCVAGMIGGGRYRIRTCDFHRVKMALYR